MNGLKSFLFTTETQRAQSFSFIKKRFSVPSVMGWFSVVKKAENPGVKNSFAKISIKQRFALEPEPEKKAVVIGR